MEGKDIGIENRVGVSGIGELTGEEREDPVVDVDEIVIDDLKIIDVNKVLGRHSNVLECIIQIIKLLGPREGIGMRQVDSDEMNIALIAQYL